MKQKLMPRYNKLGEWKPIIFQGSVDSIESEIRGLSEDSRVRGILFYIKTTGCKTIEFVMKTKMELPVKGILTFDNKLHIYKCPKASKHQESFIYDCWFDLELGTHDEIEQELYRIRLAVNRLGLAFSNAIEWCVKYDDTNSTRGNALIKEEELKYFSGLLSASVSKADTWNVEYAIDWYNQGNRSNNAFTSFLCYYNSIEYLCTLISSGKTELITVEAKRTKLEKRKCIEKLEQELREEKPLQFIQKAYEECLKGSKYKLQKVFDAVFGEDDKYTELLLVGDESLLFIRNQIAHGSFSLFDADHIDVVKRHLYEIEEIAHHFILRLLLGKKPDEELPGWSREYALTMSFSDPRVTHVASNDRGFPTQDWTIRPQWCVQSD